MRDELTNVCGIGVPLRCPRGRDDNAAISCFAALPSFLQVILDYSPSKGETEETQKGKGLSRPAKTEKFCRKRFLAEAAFAVLHMFIHSLMELSAGAKAFYDWLHYNPQMHPKGI